MYAGLAELPEEQREALRLRYLEGLPSKEIAARLGKTDGAVRVMLTRALVGCNRSSVRTSPALTVPLYCQVRRRPAPGGCRHSACKDSTLNAPATGNLDQADSVVLWEQLSERLDALIGAWQDAVEPPRLAEFLPAGPAVLRRLTLVEAIKVDLEYRWQEATVAQAGRGLS